MPTNLENITRRVFLESGQYGHWIQKPEMPDGNISQKKLKQTTEFEVNPPII